MSVEAFWKALQESGQVVVDVAMPRASDALEALILETDASWRLELAVAPPALLVPVAVWAALRVYRACQFLVYREIEPEVIEKEFTVSSPAEAGSSSAVCYSADLAFRILPELVAQARGLSDDDPLVANLLKLAREWPLSSVGVGDLGEIDISPFIEDSCLRRLYVDRIIQRSDLSRLRDPRISAEARAALGAYHQLAPEVAKALEPARSETNGAATQSS
jgi:hypothetical protein